MKKSWRSYTWPSRKIANELDICIRDIICCYCPHEDCIIDDTQLCKYKNSKGNSSRVFVL